jgi:hypothetical protein
MLRRERHFWRISEANDKRRIAVEFKLHAVLHNGQIDSASLGLVLVFVRRLFVGAVVGAIVERCFGAEEKSGDIDAALLSRTEREVLTEKKFATDATSAAPLLFANTRASHDARFTVLFRAESRFQ